MSEQAYPLSWPTGRIRTPASARRRAVFHTGGAGRKQPLSIAVGLTQLEDELRRLRADKVVISTNLRLGKQGRAITDQPQPGDPGAAAYFRLKGKPHVLACDRWDRVADNLSAIARHIEALRAMERWGVGSLEQMFTGHLALPASIAPPRPWREVFHVRDDARPSLEVLETLYKTLAKKRHPDNGGSVEQMSELNAARDAARRELAP